MGDEEAPATTLAPEQPPPSASGAPGAPGPPPDWQALGPARPGAVPRLLAWASVRAWAWTVAPVIAALLVARCSAVNLLVHGAQVQALTVTGLYAGSAVLAVTPGLAALSVCLRRWQLGQATALGVLFGASGAAAMLGFWAWFAGPGLGRGADLAFGVASVAAIAVFGRRGDLRAVGLSVPLLLALALGLAFTGLVFVTGGGIAHDPVHAVDFTLWRASDNAIPLEFAAKLAAHGRLSGYLVGNWLSSDRPPLQTGFVMLQWPLWRGGTDLPYQLLATGLSTSWLPALWVLFRVRGAAQWRVAVAVTATALTGWVYVSTVYVWPKMLAGTLALAAFALLVSRDEADQRARRGVLAVALATLSMLAHGGTAFALIALAPFLFRLHRRVRADSILIRSVLGCAGIAASLYVPWQLYQKYVDPPGNRLMKWQLAGQIPLTDNGLLRTLAIQYGGSPVTSILANKLENVVALVADPVAWRTLVPEPNWQAGFLGYARIAQVNDLLPAAGLLLLGGFALLFPSARRALAPMAPLAAFVGIAVAFWVVLLWGSDSVPAINHMGAYAMIAAFIGLCALAVTYLPKPVMALVLAGSAAWFAVSWIPGLGYVTADAPSVHPGAAPWSLTVQRAMQASQLDPAMLLTCIAGAALAIAALAWLRFGPGWRAQPIGPG